MFWTATSIFLVAYALIISEKIHKTKVAMFGAALTLITKVLLQDEAFNSMDLGVDWNVIFLLISMMVIINIMTKTGVFQYVAIKCAKVAKGEPFRIMILFAIITAVGSAFLDNVTTVLLLVPVTLLIAEQLEINPIPYLITEALASNIGGTATLIGDPPNIMIASKAGLSFMDFIFHLTPAIIIIFLFWMLAWKVLFGKRLHVREDLKKKVMSLQENEQITDSALLKKSLIILGFTILGFMLHGFFHYEPATVALMGAATLLLVSGEEPQSILAEVEWPTIFFFIGLFIIIGGIVKVGLVEDMSRAMIAVTNPQPQDMTILAMVMLWFSAICSAIVDNIPFVATMNPLLIDMIHKIYGLQSGTATAEHIQHMAMMPVWWSLALGACLGGNGSPIGASANVIVVGLSEKAGYKISFTQFLKYGVPVMIMTVFLAMIYIYVRYYLLKWY
ncbi:possible tyrosine transporter P-protein (TC 2.A.45.2.1) [Desulfuromusa kysingii]|uniref:Possible tyrosine transporter P-protein (TC 2.A.45.2.1) n=1 Tax=Desulfuromusa kysingii TaxID=37625 RepID=A0A1H3W3X5_9BACT|nr:ArsB/NhaD family transporter [Desulfuromusa kysingii]SDZ81819.1 possible tyrosine transporter P-protein (TC 2.A.45.2.1) [Desulfuromusa kysingii]